MIEAQNGRVRTLIVWPRLDELVSKFQCGGDQHLLVLLSKFQGFVHGSELRIARLAHQSTGNWIGQLHATRSKPLVRDHSDTRHGIVMPQSCS